MSDIDATMQSAGALADALQDVLRQLIEKIVGGPSQGKNGEPLRDLCVMVRPLGDPIDPRDFSFPWDPAGGDSSGDPAVTFYIMMEKRDGHGDGHTDHGRNISADGGARGGQTLEPENKENSGDQVTGSKEISAQRHSRLISS